MGRAPRWVAADNAEPDAPGAEEAEGLRDRLGIAGPGSQRAIVTPVWYLRTAGAEELFVRPDDRWQVNNVADRCAEVVELLRKVYSHFEQAVQSGQLSQIPPLHEALVTPPG